MIARRPVWNRLCRSLAVLAALPLTLAGCAAPATAPSLVVGEVTLQRSELVPELLELQLPLFNLRETALTSYRLEGVLSPRSDGESASDDGWPLRLEVRRRLAGRSRDVHVLAFDPPYAAVPPEGLNLQSLAIRAIAFEGGAAAEPILLGYPVAERSR